MVDVIDNQTQGFQNSKMMDNQIQNTMDKEQTRARLKEIAEEITALASQDGFHAVFLFTHEDEDGLISCKATSDKNLAYFITSIMEGNKSNPWLIGTIHEITSDILQRTERAETQRTLLHEAIEEQGRIRTQSETSQSDSE